MPGTGTKTMYVMFNFIPAVTWLLVACSNTDGFIIFKELVLPIVRK